MWRTIRWLDRCIETHEKSGRSDVQNLFAIVQGGIDHDLRDKCLDEMINRKDRVAGYAVGGLSGGEAKGICSLLEMFAIVVSTLICRCFLEDVRRRAHLL